MAEMAKRAMKIVDLAANILNFGSVESRRVDGFDDFESVEFVVKTVNELQ